LFPAISYSPCAVFTTVLDVLGQQVRSSSSSSSWITFRPFSKSVHHFLTSCTHITSHRHQQPGKLAVISNGRNVIQTSKANHPMNIFVQPIVVAISYQLTGDILLIKLYVFHFIQYPCCFHEPTATKCTNVSLDIHIIISQRSFLHVSIRNFPSSGT
jgi:hypothetical protein